MQKVCHGTSYLWCSGLRHLVENSCHFSVALSPLFSDTDQMIRFRCLIRVMFIHSYQGPAIETGDA